MVYARFNEEDTIFQLYFRVIIMLCHKDVTLAEVKEKAFALSFTANIRLARLLTRDALKGHTVSKNGSISFFFFFFSSS